MKVEDIFEQKQNLYIESTSTSRGGIYFCILVGLICFALGMYSGEQTRTWGSFIFNLLFFFALGLGGVVFSGMQDVVGATWGRPIMRLHEAFAAFLPLVAAFLIFFFACIHFEILEAHKVFKWIANPGMLEHFWGKKTWLQPNFMMIRDTFAILTITGLAYWQLKTKLKRDLMLLKGDKSGAASEGKHAAAKLRHWSAPVLFIYAVLFTLLCFDLTMSLSPLWYSTLWGGWSFAVMMQTLMASLLLLMFSLKNKPIGQIIKKQQFHDVGKLMHGFTIFFAYLTYAHVLTYWYGNVPEETEYFLHRLHGPWFGIVIATPILAFVFPLFALIPKASKWTAAFTIPIAGTILFAQWMTYLVIVQPEVTSGDGWNAWIEVGLFLGMLGAFLSCFFWFAKRFPMVSIADPMLARSLADSGH